MSTPDPRLERELSELLGDIAPSTPPRALIPDTERAVAGARRWPRWLALFKEPPMRTRSSLAVGSPTARVVAVMAATFLFVFSITAAGVGANRLLLDLRTIVVDASGGGDVLTIHDGVLRANDGDRVLVRPGEYVEAVVIERDIALIGDGPAGSIVVRAPDDGPVAPTTMPESMTRHPYAIRLQHADADVRDISLVGSRSQLHIIGGSPRIEGLTITGVAPSWRDQTSYKPTFRAVGASIIAADEASPTIVSNRIIDGGPIRIDGGSTGTIDRNVLVDGPTVAVLRPGDGLEITGNHIVGTPWDAIAVHEIRDRASIRIEGNTIELERRERITPEGVFVDRALPGGPALSVEVIGNEISGANIGMRFLGGNDVMVRENTFVGSVDAGILAGPGASAEIRGNTFEDNRTAVSVTDSDALIEGNVVRGGKNGIVTVLGGVHELRNNDVAGVAGTAIMAMPGTSPTLSGNALCGNATNVSGLDEAVVAGDNEICAD